MAIQSDFGKRFGASLSKTSLICRLARLRCSPKLRATKSSAPRASSSSSNLIAELSQQPDSVQAVFGQKQAQPILLGASNTPTAISFCVESFDSLLEQEPDILRDALRLADRYQLAAFLTNADHFLAYRADSERPFWTSSDEDLCKWVDLLHQLNFPKAIPAATAAFLTKTPGDSTAAQHLAASRKAAYLGPLPASSLLPIICEFFDDWQQIDVQWSALTSSIDREGYLRSNPISRPAAYQPFTSKHSPSSIEDLLPGYNKDLWANFGKAAGDWWPKRQLSAKDVQGWATAAADFGLACDDMAAGHNK